MQVISGALKNYEWGSASGLRAWTAGPAPLAELWFGVHPSGASPVVGAPGSTLDAVLTSDQAPILVKLLSAAKPLSVQVHPDAAFAARGFQEINPIYPAGAQPFADQAEKTEMLVALTDFTAFAGWRPLVQVRQLFAELASITGTDPANYFPADTSYRDSFAALVRSVAHLPNREAVIAALPRAVDSVIVDPGTRAAYRTVVQEYPNDPGCLLTLFLDVVHLAPGESIFVPAGVPHSYIHGTGLEVMTTSDNVLRLGLTPKPVFADLALEALSFDEVNQRPPFTVDVSTHAVNAASGHYRVVVALESTTTVTCGTSVTVEQGQSAVITAAEPEAEISTDGRFALVTAVGFA